MPHCEKIVALIIFVAYIFTMVTLHTKTDRFIVTQSNDLIEASYSPALTARAHKVARLIFSLISPEDADLKLYTVEINALKRFLGYKANVTWGRFNDDLKDIAQRLNKEPITINGGKGKTLTAFFIAAYEIDLKKGIVTFEVPSMLKPYLFQLKNNFTKYPLKHIPRLKSSYSIRLYELLYQYRIIGSRVFEIDDLQRKIGSDYGKYSHFKSRVLAIAERDLSDYTDIRFEYDEIKSGKKVERLEFFIYANTPKPESPQQSLLTFLEDATEREDKPILSKEIKQTLDQLGIAETVIEKYLREGFRIIEDTEKRRKAIERCTNIEAYYLEKISLLQQSRTKGGDNPAGFFITALKQDWQSSSTVKEQQKKTAQAQRRQARQILAGLEAEKERLNAQHETKRKAAIEELLADEEIFSSFYAQAVMKMGNLKAVSIKPDLSPRENYQASPILSSSIHLLLEKAYPQTFHPLVTSRQEIEAVEKKIKELAFRLGQG